MERIKMVNQLQREINEAQHALDFCKNTQPDNTNFITWAEQKIERLKMTIELLPNF